MCKALIRRVAAGWVLAAVLLVFRSTGSAQYTNGIYAEFNTSMGSCTCALYYAYAPKAVANFIGLATGQRSWLDLPGGMVKTNPFYNGTTFHRVIAGFVIQGGSPNGQGTDGPGYQFVDEFTNTLRHDGFGVLSMANSGPDSNGSQYFITVSAQPQLNDVHTIFGRLYGGSNVVYAINHVATDANDKPLTNVVVQSVVIQRIGAAAQAFDINAQGLALPVNLNSSLAKSGANFALSFSNRLYADNRLYASSTLTQWTGIPLGIVTQPESDTIQINNSFPVRFFHMAQVQYPPVLFVPRNVLGRTVTLNFSSGIAGNIVVAFDNAGSGIYTWSGGATNVVLGYTWVQDPYRGRLSPILLNGFPFMVLHLDYDTATSGTFKGAVEPSYPSTAGSFSAAGTFTSSP